MKNYSEKSTQENTLDSLFKNLEAKTFQRKLIKSRDSVIIDVSSPDEFAKGSIPKAINISYQSDDFWERIEPYKDRNDVFVYSHTGHKSVRACALMRNGGFEKDQIFNLEGGYRCWRRGRI